MPEPEQARLNEASAEFRNNPNAASVVEMIDEGNALEERGRLSEALSRYDAALRTDPRCARAHLNRGNILLAGAQMDEARSAYRLAIDCEPQYAAAHFNLGNLYYRLGDFDLAIRSYRAAVGIKPDFVDAFVAMANALDSLGRAAEAVETYERALAILPEYAEVHFNLGVIAMNQGRNEEAVKNLRRALKIRPDLAQAHRTMGIVLSRLEELEAAEESHRSALAIEPESEEILYELAMILFARGKPSDALPLLIPALERTPTWNIKVAFASCAARTGFLVDDPRIRAALETAINEPWGAPYQLCRSALSLVMLDPRIARCVRLANASWPARLPQMSLFGPQGLDALATDPLLHAILEAAPVSTLEFERFLTCARRALLETAASARGQDLSENMGLRFYAALSRQCFVNEYIFGYDDEEKLAAHACRSRLLALLDTNTRAPPLLVLAVASYFPLFTLSNASRLLDANHGVPIDDVLRQQIREPLEERSLRAGIALLTPITGGVSQEVRSQYEQNPYPRWVRRPTPEHALPFNEELRRAMPFARFEPLASDEAPEALVAGCGTGSHSILTARRFRGVRVLAIDLSLSSISYAKRKTQEMGITNIEYAQADILKIGGITRTFDVIESVGVLHHLADPLAGWRTLVSRLRPGGFMFLGFYSEIARSSEAMARDIIERDAYSSSPDEIRRFRGELAVHNPTLAQSLSRFPDYFSTSDCRDLLFHVQEHRLTLQQVDSMLVELGVNFIGFEMDRGVLHNYRVRFPDDSTGTNLRNWASFETDFPDTFAGMYQFWIQKPAKATAEN
jgi:tetratricopeptide (TPR) repeat protein/2-polyprenyl-3-methyl-5-hydroxy-6-metoxy-1,4-benzoquinol methylase